MIKVGLGQQAGQADKAARAAVVSKLKEWAERQLPPSLETEPVMVSELRCGEPGCPPLETVVSVMRSPDPIVFKVHKPMAEVTQAELEESMRRALAAAGVSEARERTAEHSHGDEHGHEHGDEHGDEHGHEHGHEHGQEKHCCDGAEHDHGEGAQDDRCEHEHKQ